MAGQGVLTRTGKSRWDRSVIWGMLRNPAYAGRAVFGKTQIIHEQPGLNRVAAAPTRHKSSDEDGQQVWTMNTCGGLDRRHHHQMKPDVDPGLQVQAWH